MKRRTSGDSTKSVLLNERGEVSECTSANIFAARGRDVWTPPLNSGCLPGVTRAVLLEEIRRARSLGLSRKRLLPQDLEASRPGFHQLLDSRLPAGLLYRRLERAKRGIGSG